MKKPTIVLCNDDSIHAPGIYELWKSLRSVATLWIVAPAEDQSCKGMGISLPRFKHIEAEKIAWEEDAEAWKVYGTPADCIKFALDYLLKEKPDFILSGINDGSNAGRNIIHSGTIAATIQATFSGVAGIAFSCMYDEGPEKFGKAAPFIPVILDHFIEHPLPKGTLMNINFPRQDKEPARGFRMARQGQSYWNVRIGSDSSLKGTKKYPILDSWDFQEEHEESDIYLLEQGFITCVPIHIQDLTDHRHQEAHKPFFEKLNTLFFPKENLETSGEDISSKKI
jgi:5'-nucleotidase